MGDSVEDYQILEEIASSTEEEPEDDDLLPVKRRKEEKSTMLSSTSKLLEEISSSETEEFNEISKQSTELDLELQAHNETDLKILIKALETNNSKPAEVCYFCYRVGHKKKFCSDKPNLPLRQDKYWKQGMLQRKFIFYDTLPKVKKLHEHRINYSKRKKMVKNAIKRAWKGSALVIEDINSDDDLDKSQVSPERLQESVEKVNSSEKCTIDN